MEFTVHQAKTQFSKLIAHALAGEEVIITHGKERNQIIKLVPIQGKIRSVLVGLKAKFRTWARVLLSSIRYPRTNYAYGTARAIEVPARYAYPPLGFRPSLTYYRHGRSVC